MAASRFSLLLRESAPGAPTFAALEVAGKNTVGKRMIKQIATAAIGIRCLREIVRFTILFHLLSVGHFLSLRPSSALPRDVESSELQPGGQ